MLVWGLDCRKMVRVVEVRSANDRCEVIRNRRSDSCDGDGCLHKAAICPELLLLDPCCWISEAAHFTDKYYGFCRLHSDDYAESEGGCCWCWLVFYFT